MCNGSHTTRRGIPFFFPLFLSGALFVGIVMAALQPKEQKLFENLTRQYENHEFAKALRTADAILSIAPTHAETIASKGLTLHSSGSKDEGFTLIKQAVATNMKASLCWHYYGIAHRSDKNYHEAIKCFKMALKQDPTNVSVMRDLANMFIQTRDWESFVEMRQKILAAKFNVRAHWIALSVGHRMLKNYEMASAIIDVMVSIMDTGDNAAEKSETHLYRAELAFLSNKPQLALDVLRDNDKEICDSLMKQQLRAKAHALMHQKDKTEKVALELIAQRFAEKDNIALIAQSRGIQLDKRNLPTNATDASKFVELLDGIVAKVPRCDYAKRLLLDSCPIESFKDRLAAYAKPFITKMIPSLFTVLKSLYAFPERAVVIGLLFTEWDEQLAAKNFSSFNDAPNPGYSLWVKAYLASHFTRLGQYATAHLYIDAAIKHTPTVEMLYLMRAKILQREGRLQEAAESANMARLLDLQDKYLNGKAAKYLFRAGDVDAGEQTMQLFYKTSPVNDAFLVALESQCAWYEREVGNAFLKKGDVLSALQNFLMYERHVRDNNTELMDFHAYAFRRANIRPWIDVIEHHDNIDAHKFFLDIAAPVVQCYLKIDEEGEEKVKAQHSPRQEPPATGQAEEDKRRSKWFKEFVISVDLSKPLEKAARYIEALVQHRGERASTHELAISYFARAQRPVAAARSLLALYKIDKAAAAAKAPLVAAINSTLPAVQEVLAIVKQ